MRTFVAVLATFGLAWASSVGAADPIPPTASVLNDQAQRCRRILKSSIIDFYLPACVDTANGGYLETLRGDTFAPTGEKFLTLQARQLWFFSTLAATGIEKDASLAAAKIGFDFLESKFRDPLHGGYFAKVSDAGTPTDRRKHVYPNAFALYALAAYHRATAGPAVLAAAKDLFQTLEAKAHDAIHGGYVEFFEENWTPISDPRVQSFIGPGGTKTYNSHLHVLEALAELYRVWPDPLVRNRLEELLVVNTQAVRLPKHGCNVDGFTPDWNPIETPQNLRASFGHDVEGAWLCLDAARTLGHSPHLFRGWAEGLVGYSLQHGFDTANGGFFYTGPLGRAADDTKKEWWVQAEAMVSMLEMYRLTGRTQYYEAFDRTLDFVVKHQVAKEGSWWATRRADGSPAGTSRTSMWQGAYHNGRSMLLCAKLLDELAGIDKPALPLHRGETDYAEAIGKLKSAVRHEMEHKRLPAFSMSLVDGENRVWADGFGFQDADKKVPATADSVYRVGSVSKLFTDIAVMQLVDENRLDLDLPVQKYLPDFAPENPFGVPITLRQLMSHRSGLVRESPIGHYFDPDEPTLAATVASLNNTTLIYKPETKTKYSNAAVSVVGSVLESQLDVSHPQRVRQTILDPLEMSSSSFVVTPTVKPKLATGWMRTYDGRRFKAPTFLLGTGPAGNLYSSVNDLTKFLVCLFNNGKTPTGQILKSETLQAMMLPIKDSEGKSQGFGLGFHVQELDGHKKIGHGGAVYGFSTQLEALPERRLGVAAAASLDGSNGVVERLANYALRLMVAAQDGKPLPSYRTTGPVPLERAKELVGKYRAADGEMTAHITELNGDVFVQRGSFRFELRSAADDGSIIADDSLGFGTEVKLRDSGKLLIDGDAFDRIRDTPPADIPHRWKGLVGEYGWDHNVLYILEDNGQLYALIEWFYYYPLKEISENVFEFPGEGLYHGEGLKFARDASGVATVVNAAEVRFVRREVGTKDGETFKITPVKPIDELRATALAASPPPEPGEFRDTDLVELVLIDPTIRLDIRYATANNFTSTAFYKLPRALMQRPVAQAVGRASARLKERGLGLLVHDSYRPWHVTKMFWDATPDDMKIFVANPANGSRHNRGCAVDLTLYDLQTGQPIQMVAGYDEFSPRSYPMYPGGTSQQRWYRELLRRSMETEGFTVYENEWWHFDFKDWKKYRIGNVPL